MTRWVIVSALITGVSLASMSFLPEALALDDKSLVLFQKLDGNSDDRIDRTEFRNLKTSILFMPRDGKEDEDITFENTLVNRAEFDAADADGNGVLSSLEWITAPFSKFERIDTNSDQAISVEEFEAFAKEALR